MAADGAERVEDLAAEEEAGGEAALQGAGIDLGEGHAAAGDLGLAVALVARPGEGMIGEGLDEPAPLVPTELRERTRALHARVFEEGLGEPVGEMAAEESEGGARGLAEEPVPGVGIQIGPLDVERLPGAAGQPGTDGQMGEVEDRGAAVAAVGEEEAAVAGGGALRSWSAEGHRPRDAGEGSVARRLQGEGSQSRVRLVEGVAEPADHGESGAIAAGAGKGKPAGRYDHGRRGDRFALRETDPPRRRPLRRLETGGEGIEPDLRAPAPGEIEETVPDLSRAVRNREELARLGLQSQGDARLLLEEPPLLGERPRGEDLPQRVGRGIRDEPRRIGHGGQDVAPPAAADQDLASTVASPLENQDAATPPRGEDGRDEPRGARAEDEDGEIRSPRHRVTKE